MSKTASMVMKIIGASLAFAAVVCPSSPPRSGAGIFFKGKGPLQKGKYVV